MSSMTSPSDEQTTGSSDANYVNMEEASSNPNSVPSALDISPPTPAAQSLADTAPFPYYKRNLLLGVVSRVLPVGLLFWFLVYHFDNNQQGQLAYNGFAALAAYLCTIELVIMVSVYWHTIVDPVMDASSNGNSDTGLWSPQASTDSVSSVQILYKLELTACHRFFRINPTVMTVSRELFPAIISVTLRIVGYEYHNTKGKWAIYFSAAVLLLPIVVNLVRLRFHPNSVEDANARFIVLILRDFYSGEYASITSATSFSSNVVYEFLFYGDFLRLCLLNCACMNGI